jgi:hypothetical protein
MRRIGGGVLGKKMKKARICCKALKDKIRLRESNFMLLEKSGQVLLNCGDIRIPMKAMERLAAAIMGAPLSKKLRSLNPNKLIKSPVLIPIAFCPFCGKKIITSLYLYQYKRLK